MQWFHLPSEISVHICSTKETINQHTFRMTKYTETNVGWFKKQTIKTRSTRLQTALSAFVSHPKNEVENTHFVVDGGMRWGYLKMIVQHMWTEQTRTTTTTTTKQQVFRFTPPPSSGRRLYSKGNKRNCMAKAILLKKETHLVLGAHKVCYTDITAGILTSITSYCQHSWDLSHDCWTKVHKYLYCRLFPFWDEVTRFVLLLNYSFDFWIKYIFLKQTKIEYSTCS